MGNCKSGVDKNESQSRSKDNQLNKTLIRYSNFHLRSFLGEDFRSSLQFSRVVKFPYNFNEKDDNGNNETKNEPIIDEHQEGSFGQRLGDTL
jgi:hypothetical protein